MKLTLAFLISTAVLAVLLVVKPADSCPHCRKYQPRGWVEIEERRSVEPYEDDTWKMERKKYDMNQRIYQQLSSQHHTMTHHEEHDVDDYRLNKPMRQSHRWVDHKEKTVTHDYRNSWEIGK